MDRSMGSEVHGRGMTRASTQSLPLATPTIQSCPSTTPTSPGSGDGQQALGACLQKWVQRQIEMRTPYDIRLTTTALGALLVRPSSALDAVAVRGRRLDVEVGILTRSRAAQRAERWSSVPLRAKIAQLLVDAYIEATAQDLHRGGPSDDDEEWEEGSGSGSDDAGPRPYNGAAARGGACALLRGAGLCRCRTTF